MSLSFASLPPRRAEMPRQRIATGFGPAFDALFDCLKRSVRRPPRGAGRSHSPGKRRSFTLDLAIRRRLYLILVLATTAVGAAHLWAVLRTDGVSGLEIALFVVFIALFLWIATAFWLAWFGFVARRRSVALDALAGARRRFGKPATRSTRTAIVMPIYNEDVARVFAGLAAIGESIRAAGGLRDFDFHVLSDSTDGDLRAAEERHFRRFREAFGEETGIYYRHRAANVGRKSGNIADFCCNWGRHYECMVVLDADSLMTGETLIELAGLMDSNPDTALIQVPPRLVGRDSLFARMQQFASSVYGPLVAAGMASLSGPDANYWGHNAIIRIAPFMAHCGLPELPGKPPLGGEILSHDFVEAALLHRAGWQVWLASDLGGSYEESPPTLVDHLARDRRWCEGNLQHARLLLARGFRLPSRLNFAVGIMSYVSSPLWLILLVLTGIEAWHLAGIPPVDYVGAYPVLSWSAANGGVVVLLIAFAAMLLFGPKLLAYFDLRCDASRLAAHGGSAMALASIVLETLASALFAPIAMLTHTQFVVEILLGRSTVWSGQQRGDYRPTPGAVARLFAPHTAVAVAAAAIALLAIPDDLVWLLPVLVGLAVAIPIVGITSSVRTGRRARQWRLFLTPSETVRVPVVDRVAALLGDAAARRIHRSARTVAGLHDRGLPATA